MDNFIHELVIGRFKDDKQGTIELYMSGKGGYFAMIVDPKRHRILDRTENYKEIQPCLNAVSRMAKSLGIKGWDKLKFVSSKGIIIISLEGKQ